MTQNLMFLLLKGLEGFLAVSCAIQEVVVHARHDALLVDHVRNAAVNGAKHSALHFPVFTHLGKDGKTVIETKMGMHSVQCSRQVELR